MRRPGVYTALLLALVATVAACRQFLPSNRYLQLRESAPPPSTRDALTKFNHRTHAAQLKAAHVTCVECHRFDEVIESSNDEMAQELSARGLYPGAAPCHYCHVSADTRVAAAPSTCTTCHGNLLAIEPPDHQVAWLKVHASIAQTNPSACDNCHRQSFCIDCHERRDTIQTRVHDRNFRYFHSVQARANPMQCGSCHRLDFCINCHKQGNVGGLQ